MSLKETLEQRGVEVVRREYGDHRELVADFGPNEDITVDVVGDTVIVVAAEETHDLEVDGSAQAFIKNGVLTIEVTEETQA
jgi:HSP20 family molecular chaperone IbpA